MNPLQAEIYNIIYEAGQHGLRLNEIYEASRLALDRIDAVQAVHELRAEGKVIWISKDGHKRYLAGTVQHIEALKADAAKKREASKAPPPPPPKDIKGREAPKKVEPKLGVKALVESATWHGDSAVFSVRVLRKDLPDVNFLGHEIELLKKAQT